MENETVINIWTGNIKKIFEPIRKQCIEDIEKILEEKYVPKKEIFQLVLKSLVEKSKLAEGIIVKNAEGRDEGENLKNMTANIQHIQYEKKEEENIINMLKSEKHSASEVLDHMIGCIQKELCARAKIYTGVANVRDDMASSGVDVLQALNYYLYIQAQEEMCETLLNSLSRKVYKEFEANPEELLKIPIQPVDTTLEFIRRNGLFQILNYCECILGRLGDDFYPSEIYIQIYCFILTAAHHSDAIKKMQKKTTKIDHKKVLEMFGNSFNLLHSTDEQLSRRMCIVEMIKKDMHAMQAMNGIKDSEDGDKNESVVIDLLTAKPPIEELYKEHGHYYRLKNFLKFIQSIFSLVFMLNMVVKNNGIMGLSMKHISKPSPIEAILSIMCIIDLYNNPILMNKRNTNLSPYKKHPEDFLYLVGFFVLMSTVMCIMFPTNLLNYSIYLFELVLILMNLGCSLGSISHETKNLFVKKINLREYAWALVKIVFSMAFTIAMHLYFKSHPNVSDVPALNILICV
ncbi:hypothetical protein NEPAR06_0725 [Nematocida parisii]|uniref:Uncharacterized protein n=1 Tax=Nematocida parisii (strain ERTm3) TaxID=935791 RepID=I3EHS4_NEMP3|nr:uncharacterized protein NEPG_02371 [Nematocida parisii ERTm1]EIJ88771.1 hypothetical protein NEQG_00590 [Nematocida parisii ERTm3]KAI5143004.1 hypothetical protein NEPAR07_0420 [Nematocida parisii]EIJ92680.1 hypothetical protein NEPG_02371 [Nematocida parisii ERTm1]KAI5153767.1 hypothetical protein NEPAR06_0725 [Nematocida parisii]KAI5156120.1 hypothetical protein NEPAR05_0297 [Nematocida parisii]|eukprot:XP_013060198.1 hypothetical protein NEPG_02371 [Nematocida parisii ERTm1]